MSLEYDASTEDAEDFPVILTKKDGTKEEYFLRSFDCAGKNAYLNASSKRWHTEANGEQSIHDYSNLEATLLTRCMYRRDTGKLVTEKEVNGFPPKFARRVIEKAREICALDDKAEETAKNS